MELYDEKKLQFQSKLQVQENKIHDLLDLNKNLSGYKVDELCDAKQNLVEALATYQKINEKFRDFLNRTCTQESNLVAIELYADENRVRKMVESCISNIDDLITRKQTPPSVARSNTSSIRRSVIA